MNKLGMGLHASILGVGLLLGSTAQAGVVSYDSSVVNFTSTNQSMWGEGAAASLNKSQFIGDVWNTSTNIDLIEGNANTRVIGTGGTIPNPARPIYDAAFALCRIGYSASTCRNGGKKFLGVQVPLPLGSRPSATINNPIPPKFVDTRTGIKGTATTEVKVGFEVGLSASAGSVDSEVAYDVSLDVPDVVVAGEFINLNGSSNIAKGSLESAFPTLEASLSFVAEASAGFTGTGCITLTGCKSGTVSTGTLGGTTELLSVNQNGEGSIEYFDGDPILNALLFQNASPPQGLPHTANVANLLEVTAHLPNPSVQGELDGNGKVSGSGQDDLLDLLVDVDSVVSLGVAGTTTGFGGELELGAIGTVSFDLLDVKIGPTIDLAQAFEFTPTLYVDLAFSQAVDVLGRGVVTEAKDLLFDAMPDLAFGLGETLVTPTLFLGVERNGSVMRGVELLNELFLDVDGTMRVDLLEATFSLLNLFDLDLGIGNVFDDSLDLFATPAIFSSLFNLGGFNDVRLDAFSVATAGIPSSVPEPATRLLLLMGIVALIRMRTRKVRNVGVQQ